MILGTPPFVRAEDKLARRAYMKRWTAAIKGFHLWVPFLEPILREAVPDGEAAFKPRYKTLRGKLNVPRERFRSLASKPGFYVWAGK